MYIITITRDDVELASLHIEDRDQAHKQWDREIGQAPPGAYLTFRDDGRITKQHAVPVPDPTDEPVAEPAEPIVITGEAVIEPDKPRKRPASKQKPV